MNSIPSGQRRILYVSNLRHTEPDLRPLNGGYPRLQYVSSLFEIPGSIEGTTVVEEESKRCTLGVAAMVVRMLNQGGRKTPITLENGTQVDPNVLDDRALVNLLDGMDGKYNACTELEDELKVFRATGAQFYQFRGETSDVIAELRSGRVVAMSGAGVGGRKGNGHTTLFQGLIGEAVSMLDPVAGERVVDREFLNGFFLRRPAHWGEAPTAYSIERPAPVAASPVRDSFTTT